MSSTKKMTSREAVPEVIPTTGVEDSNPTPLPAYDPDALIAAFAAKWPACFSVDEAKRRPLKLKIHFEIFPSFAYDDRDAIRAALRRYVYSDSYLRNLKVEAERIGLDGKPAGEVSDLEAESARNRIKSREDYEAEINKRLHAANADKPRRA
jgi:sRNA-binding protein